MSAFAHHFETISFDDISMFVDVSLTQCAIVSRKFAGWTRPVKLDSTDTADFIFRHVPFPCGNGMPFFNSDFHVWVWKECNESIQQCLRSQPGRCLIEDIRDTREQQDVMVRSSSKLGHLLRGET